MLFGACFIPSVGDLTLETFEFEQGVSGYIAECIRIGEERRFHGWGHNRAPSRTRPMDDRFMDRVFPVIISNSWPELKDLKIIGVGTRRVPAMQPTTKARLAKHLGKQASIKYQDVGERPCEEFSGELAR